MPRRTILLAFGIYGAVSALSAQNRAPGLSSSPISVTSVFHGVVDLDSAGAPTLGFALIIRGPENWWNARTATRFAPADSAPVGGQQQTWTVGERSYTLRYDPQVPSLEVSGQRIVLSASRVVLATLGAKPSDPIRLELSAPVRLELRPNISIAGSFLWDAPEARAFAGVPDPPRAP